MTRRRIYWLTLYAVIMGGGAWAVYTILGWRFLLALLGVWLLILLWANPKRMWEAMDLPLFPPAPERRVRRYASVQLAHFIDGPLAGSRHEVPWCKELVIEEHTPRGFKRWSYVWETAYENAVVNYLRLACSEEVVHRRLQHAAGNGSALA